MISLGIFASARTPPPPTPPPPPPATGPQFIGAGMAVANAATLPTYSVGDIIVVVAFGFGTTIPSLPAGWTSAASSAATMGRRVGWKKATAAGTTTGVWTNAEAVYAGIWHGFGSVGASASTATWSANGSIPALTLATPATSWVATLSVPDSGQAPVPSGTVARWNDGESRWCDTGSAPGAWTARAGTLFLGASIEMKI